MIKETISVKHEFTPDELRDIALQLANRVNDLEAKDDQRKTAASQFKAEIDRINAEIRVLSTHYRSGYEFRNTRCYVTFNFDLKRREYYTVDGDKLVHNRERQTKRGNR